MAEDDDPAIQEFDVFLSKGLADQLYLFQYPMRPASVTYNDVTHLSARVKPKQQKVELDLAINTTSANYAHSKGEQIALNVDGRDPDLNESHFNSQVMDKQTLTSNPNVRDLMQYAIGIIKNNELHLTPLKSVVQLKPSFAYLDKADSRQKVEAGAAATGDSGDGIEEEEEAKPITVRYARPESEEAKARRLASFEYLHKRLQEEKWIECAFHTRNSALSQSRYRQLFSAQTNDSGEFYMQPDEYLKVLVPPSSQTEDEKPAMPTNVLSMTHLKSMSLNDQIKAILINANVIRFCQLMALLPRDTDSTTCLRALQQVAVLIQGCWVVKSEALYPKDTFSAHTGVPADILNRGRDFVMWRFTQNRFVIRRDLSSVIKLPAEDVKDILEQMSHVRVNRGWEFLMDYDREFVDKYPDIVQRQHMLWDAKYQQLINLFKITKEMEKKLLASADPQPPARRRTVSRSKSKSMSDGSDVETAHDAPRHDADPSRAKSHENMNGGCAEISFTTLPATFSNRDVDDDAPVESGGGVAVEPVEFVNELTNFIQEKLYSRYVMSLSDVRRCLAVTLSQLTPGHVLASHVISDHLLDRTVQRVGGASLMNQWPPNMKSEKMFALIKTGDKLDELRALVFSMFEDAYKIKMVALKARAESEICRTITDSECRKLLKDYCISKGSFWYLKGTLPAS